jgi:hypothetical protein
MRRLLNEIPWVIGVFMFGMLLGSRLGPNGNMWRIFLALGAISLGLSLIQTVRRLKTPRTTPA